MAKNVVRVIAFATDLETGLTIVCDVLEAINTRRNHINPRELKRWARNAGLNDWHGPITGFKVERRAVNQQDRDQIAMVASSMGY